eukprot:comp9848_c1_seq1/m.4798 comp9848_c1_seq1/g.4798  ORF comp9848_c1_seq1/g.4798 comp9848_c1_seq1/m.4798 type:complete len:204 (-) comp9848_c1_seq1:88-699(-)
MKPSSTVHCRTADGVNITFTEERLEGSDSVRLFTIHVPFFSVSDILVWAASVVTFVDHPRNPLKEYRYPATILLVCWLVYSLTCVREESLLIIQNQGVQLTTKYKLPLRPANVRFITQERIQETIINEAVHMHRVVFYLAFLTPETPQEQVTPRTVGNKLQGGCFEKEHPRRDTKMIVAFPHFLPRLAQLKVAYGAAQQLLQS